MRYPVADESLINAYVAALQVRPIAIDRDDSGKRSRLGIARTTATTDALWFPKMAHAELVVTMTIDALRDAGAMGTNSSWIELGPSVVRDFVTAAAEAAGAEWRTDAELRAMARASVDKILFEVESSRRMGGLKQVNQAYRAARLAGTHDGKSYQRYLAEWVRGLVIAAGRSSAEFPRTGGT